MRGRAHREVTKKLMNIQQCHEATRRQLILSEEEEAGKRMENNERSQRQEEPRADAGQVCW